MTSRLRHEKNLRLLHRRHQYLLSMSERIPFWTYALGPRWGRTEWWKFWVIHVASFLMLACFFIYNDAAKHICPLIGSAILIGSWWGTYGNWLLDRDPKYNSNNHINQVIGEGHKRPFLRKPYGAPITDFGLWWRARYEKSERDVEVYLNALENDDTELLRLHQEFIAYTKTFKR